MKAFLLLAIIFCVIQTKATNFYFSSVSGDDSRSSSVAQDPLTPWQTIKKLNAYFSSINPGDSLLFKRGETFYGSIILDKSGTKTAPIIIGAYGIGANPVITGLVPLTWLSAGNDLWISNEALTVGALNMVTVNGVPAGMGRWPNLDNGNGGYDSIRSSTFNTITDEQGLKTAPSAGKPANFVGAEIVVRTKRWLLDRHPILSYNSSSSTIKFDPSSSNEVPDNNKGYFIQDDSTVLDKETEWWYNRDNGKLKMNSNSLPTNVSAANIENLLTSPGKSYLTVDNLTFNGCNADAISIADGSTIVIQNCTIQNVGRNAIKTATPYCSFLNNTILDVMSKGILINSQAEYTVVRYNSIRNVSQIPGLGTSQQEDGGSSFSGDGVYVRENSATVEYNKFVNMGYSAVHLTKVDSAVIRYNFIDTVCNVYDDGGAIYSYTGEAYPSYGRKISNNIILHGIGAFFGSGVNGGSAAGAGVAGIYNDRGTSGVEEEGNTVAYFEKGIFMNYGCTKLDITNNTFYHNYNGIQINTRNDDKTRNLAITGNIAFAAIPLQTTLNIYSDDGDALNNFGTINSNYYARPIKDKITMSWQSNAGSDTHYLSLAEWQEKYPEYDANSKKSPQAITHVSQIRFEYNATNEAKIISLDNDYLDTKGNTYSNNITLQPYTSTILMATSDSVQNSEPSVSITSPLVNANFTALSSINITATAADSDGSVTQVEFYKGDSLLHIQSTSPYSFTWNNVAPGNYILLAKAIDNDGLTTTSDSIPVSVTTATANLSPVVSIASPFTDTTFSAPAVINISAVASDADGSVSKVDFYNGLIFLGADSTSPYTFTWNNVTSGNYVLTAKATDNDGLITTSDSIAISVTNTAPTIYFTSPSLPANFTAPASIDISATAADTDGSVDKVDFYSGNILLATQNSSPYSFTWNNVAAGNYVLVAKVTDNGGLVTADSVAISVNNPNGAPTVSITSPSANANFTAPATINVNAIAADADGSIAKIDFYSGSTLLSTKSTSPYSFIWSNVAAGNYVLTAKATDNNGMVASDSVNVSVTINGAPLVTITSPLANGDFTAPAAININASATDADGSVVKVDFYHDDILLGTQNTSPYSFTWNNVAAGNYILTAKATDDGGLVTSDSVTISVANTNGAPTVAITSPLSNTNFKAPGAISISAIAADNDGSIAIVSFYKGNTLLGTDNTSPYNLTWNNVPAGNYALTAKATDNKGMVTLSDSVIVSVTKSGAPTVTITSPSPNAGFIAPASINIMSSAADIDGSVIKVDFYNGNTLIGTDNTSPYSLLWKNITQANYTLTARATDNKGLITSSSILTVYVIKPNVAPAVAITTPVTNTAFATTASVNIGAAATDIDGSITKVEFFNGTTLLKTEYTSPYFFTWKGVPAGTYKLTAKATDNNGRVTTSATVAVSISKPNTAPKVSLTSPKANASFTAAASISLSASASDSDGSIAKVEFFNGKTLIGTDNASPYSITWKNVAAGTYVLTAKAADNRGLVSSSNAVTIAVKPNKAPAVSITSPSQNAKFKKFASINITASATDIDGTIAKVDFYNGTTLIGTDNTSPYSFTWKNVNTGKYSLLAKATDDKGLVATSVTVAVSVSTSLAKSSGTAGKETDTATTGNTNFYEGHLNGITVSIGPNPASNILSVFMKGILKNKEVKISVLSVSGSLIRIATPGYGSQVMQVNISTLSRGMYLLKIQTADTTIFKPFEKI